MSETNKMELYTRIMNEQDMLEEEIKELQELRATASTTAFRNMLSDIVFRLNNINLLKEAMRA